MANKDLSMRKFAQLLGTTHTTVGAIMKSLNISGHSEGPGKATLLTWEEQDAITKEFLKEDSKPTQAAIEAVSVEIEVYQPSQQGYVVPDSSVSRLIGETKLMQSLDRTKQNLENLRQARLRQFAELGAQQGYEMYETFQNSMLTAFERLSTQSAQQSGLLSNDNPSSDESDL